MKIRKAKFKIDQWQKGHTLGHGSTATVSIGILANFSGNSGELFAVKSSLLSRAETLKTEQSILSSLSSPFIISCLGSDTSQDSRFNLFMELAPNGSLADLIRKKHGQLTEPFIRARAYEILSGLSYLHENNISHCDIKCDNILIGSDGRAKLADFGCSKRDFEGNLGFCKKLGFGIRGTPMYFAPETARGEKQGREADVWALGCTVIEMASGSVPWPGFADPVSVLHHIASSCEKPLVPDWISEQGKDFLAKCLNREAKQRWTAEELLKHPFVKDSGNWEEPVEKRELDSRILEKRELESGILEKRELESGISPKSVLDMEMWESLTVEVPMESLTEKRELESWILTMEPLERIGELATGKAGNGILDFTDWTDEGENWVTVRGKSGNGKFNEAPTTSGGDHMERGVHFEGCCNKGSLEGVGCKRRVGFGDYCCLSDDVLKRRKKGLREIID